MSFSIFLIASATILYVLIGYPILIALWARLFPRKVAKRFEPRTVTILLLVHNGERWLEA